MLLQLNRILLVLTLCLLKYIPPQGVVSLGHIADTKGISISARGSEL